MLLEGFGDASEDAGRIPAIVVRTTHDIGRGVTEPHVARATHPGLGVQVNKGKRLAKRIDHLSQSLVGVLVDHDDS
jgi:hypothetical protein